VVGKPVSASISMCLFTVASFGAGLAEFSTKHEAANQCGEFVRKVQLIL
jgi:hypothetical protein